MNVLIACEESAKVREAMEAMGHNAWSCDFYPTRVPGKHHQGDVFDIINDGWDMMIAFPPCTYLTVTGNKWFKPEYADRFPGRAQQREDALMFVKALMDADIEKIAIENPVGAISSRIRKPDQITSPHYFGHPVKKTTCLWLKNLPKLTPTKIVEPEFYVYGGKKYSKHHVDACKEINLELRSKIRSETFSGLANAMAVQWGGDWS